MTAHAPSVITTRTADCQDCYRCVRECVPKAIQVRGGHASVHAERCVLCGHCVGVCPVGAKQVRNDLLRAQTLLLQREQVYVSLAPSFVGQYSGISPFAVVAGIKRLGFAGVSETALGAELVAARETASEKHSTQPIISSACPAVVELVRKYYPELTDWLSPTLSPALAHARMLRELYGQEIGVVFVSPCIAKKREADAHPELIDVAITFEDLDAWFEQTGTRLQTLDDFNGQFVPWRARGGTSLPLEGGMIGAMDAGRKRSAKRPLRLAVSGLPHVREVLDELRGESRPEPHFLELLACDGGCVNGPKTRRAGKLSRARAVRNWMAAAPKEQPQEMPTIDLATGFVAAPLEVRHHSDTTIREALSQIGKYQSQDELNCGSCGYSSCREFAAAYVDGDAEQTMCVGHMRKIAQKKTDALLRAMPSAVAIVDRDLMIRECNERFARLAGEEAQLLFDAKPGLEGISVKDLIPFWELFRQALFEQDQLIDREFTHHGRVISASVFVVEEGSMVGGVFQDITEPSVHRERIITRAEEVIHKNLSTVQQIAHLMGENAAETEALLSSIIGAFGSSEDTGGGERIR